MLRKKYYLHSFIIAFFAFSAFLANQKAEKHSFIYFGSNQINITIADTEFSRQKGLGGKNTLPPDQGMFFVYEQSDYRGIWMKDMLFPIDIIWLDENYKVVDIADKVTPDTFPKIFRPRVKARYILEVKAGWSQEKNLKIGDKFDLPSQKQ